MFVRIVIHFFDRHKQNTVKVYIYNKISAHFTARQEKKLVAMQPKLFINQ